MISLIFASSRNGVIGRDGKLPWRLSEDLRRFKRLTTGGVVVMGRRTWEHVAIVGYDPHRGIKGDVAI